MSRISLAQLAGSVRKLNLNRPFICPILRESSDKIWLVRFMAYNVGFFDEDENRAEPADNLFVTQVLPMSSV